MSFLYRILREPAGLPAENETKEEEKGEGRGKEKSRDRRVFLCLNLRWKEAPLGSLELKDM